MYNLIRKTDKNEDFVWSKEEVVAEEKQIGQWVNLVAV
jgi:hypothetical protein